MPLSLPPLGSSVSPSCPGLRLPVALELIPAPLLTSYPPLCPAHRLLLPVLSSRYHSSLPSHRLCNLNSDTCAWVTATTSCLSPNFKERPSQHRLVRKCLLLSALIKSSFCVVLPSWPVTSCHRPLPPGPPGFSYFPPCAHALFLASRIALYTPPPAPVFIPQPFPSEFRLGGAEPALVAGVLIAPVSRDWLRACKVPGAACFHRIFPLPSVFFTFVCSFYIVFFSTCMLYRVRHK